MLLPLSPGETDLSSAGERETVNSLASALDERNYLLVYYVAFGQKEPERGKKKIRHSQTSSIDAGRSANSQDDRSIIFTEFHVAARLVGYNELRGSGVRLASDGLPVTGPMWEAAQSVPGSATCLQGHGDVGIAVYHSRAWDRILSRWFIEDGTVFACCSQITVDRGGRQGGSK
jgi:hypothetical protein